MPLKLKRTQKTMIGRLLMGETYRFDKNNPKQKEVAASLLKRSMAEQCNQMRASKIKTHGFCTGKVGKEVRKRWKSRKNSNLELFRIL